MGEKFDFGDIEVVPTWVYGIKPANTSGSLLINQEFTFFYKYWFSLVLKFLTFTWYLVEVFMAGVCVYGGRGVDMHACLTTM